MKSIVKHLTSVACLLVGAAGLSAAPPLYVPEADDELANQAPAIQPIPDAVPYTAASPIVPVQGQQLAPPPVPAQPPVLQPVPEQPRMHASYAPAIFPAPQPVALYPHVRVKDPHRAHPLAVKQLIQAPNPCRGQCAPVMVEVCLPPCEPLAVNVGPRGQRITYDYGRHRVEVTALRGVVTIDYDN